MIPVVRGTSTAPVRLDRRRSDLQFLPASLAIIETPPSPVGVALIWTICLLAALTIMWSYWGRIDIIATAPGKVYPNGDVKVIQPLGTGKVTAILVKNGEPVKAGEVLIELDRSAAQADVNADAAMLDAYAAEVTRRIAEREAVRLGHVIPPPPIDWGVNVSAANRARQTSILTAELADFSASIATLNAQVKQKADEQASLQTTMAAERQLIDTDATRVQMKTELLRQSAGTRSDLINATETLRYQQMMIAQFEDQLAQAQAAELVIQRQIAQTYYKFLSDNAQKLEQARRATDELRQKLIKENAALEAMTLKSPIEGTAQGLTVTTLGQVLASGTEIMRVVPRNADLEIKAYLPDSDRGFVKEGDTAIVKVASFPFTQYGTLKATVVELAKDAIPAAEAAQAEADAAAPHNDAAPGGDQPTQSLVYPVTLKLAASAFDVGGKKIPLSSGMSVTAEIRTGSRRILDYLFSPLAEVSSKAMRER